MPFSCAIVRVVPSGRLIRVYLSGRRVTLTIPLLVSSHCRFSSSVRRYPVGFFSAVG